MTFENVKEISSLKNSEKLVQTIEKIEFMLKDFNCTFSYPKPFFLENNKMSFYIQVEFPAD